MMSADDKWMLRLAILSKLVELAPAKPGRTVLMKLAYLLQVIKRVPLGYRFELYNYGPYDSDVLSDLSQAESYKAITSETVYYASGYGYEYAASKALPKLLELSGNRHEEFEDEVEWVIEHFGAQTAQQLELKSTIVFAEREGRRKLVQPEASELCRIVKRIKPHFSPAQIMEAIDSLRDLELIETIDELQAG